MLGRNFLYLLISPSSTLLSSYDFLKAELSGLCKFLASCPALAECILKLPDGYKLRYLKSFLPLMIHIYPILQKSDEKLNLSTPSLEVLRRSAHNPLLKSLVL